MLLGTQFHIPFLKPDFICVCESSLAQTWWSDGDAQRGLPWFCSDRTVMGFHRHKGEEGKGLTSAINLNAWVEDSNTQIGSVFVYPVLQRERERERVRELRRGLHSGSISRVVLCCIRKEIMQQLHRKHYDTVALNSTSQYTQSQKNTC